MTIDDVLARLREIQGWRLEGSCEAIRRDGDRGLVQCPISALENVSLVWWRLVASHFRLDDRDARAIQLAADSNYDSDLRRRLLAATVNRT